MLCRSATFFAKLTYILSVFLIIQSQLIVLKNVVTGSQFSPSVQLLKHYSRQLKQSSGK